MTNVNYFMNELSKLAPFALIGCAILSFTAVGFFCVDYYESLFLKRLPDSAFILAVLVALIQELVRFALLIASIRDFSDKKPFNGWLGLFGSLALVGHDISIAKDVALLWSANAPKVYSSIFIFLILIGLLLEIRLVLTVKNGSLGKPTAAKKEVKHAIKNGSFQPV